MWNKPPRYYAKFASIKNKQKNTNWNQKFWDEELDRDLSRNSFLLLNLNTEN